MPRITRRIFVDLAIWMVGFGIAVGLVFPPFLLAVGVPPTIAAQGWFLALCLAAGACVGAGNIALVNFVIRPRLRETAERMRMVESGINLAVQTGDWSKCDPDQCRLNVDSTDDLGDVADAFNHMLLALHRSHRVENAMDAFGNAMAKHLNLAQLCQVALDLYLRHTGAAGGVVFAERDGELELIARHAIDQPETLAQADIVRNALRQRTIQRIRVGSDVVIDAGLVQFRPTEVFVVPLSFGDLGTGVMILAADNSLHDEAESLIGLFARPLGVALHNALMHEQLQRIAALDALTGAYNRRFGMGRLREELMRSLRIEAPLGAVMFDIDHFKKVNDTYGHLAGDRVLIAVAAAARRSLREGDVLVRYGGEEFIAVLPGASLDDAALIAERIRHSCADLRIEDAGSTITVTLSAGVTSFPLVPAKDETEIVRRADEALYAAKNSGRNRVVRAQPNGAG